MKRLFTFIAAIIVATSVFAQSPEKMSYQAVVRDTEGLVSNQEVGMQISILQGTVNGTAVYTETQTPTTNVNGLISIEIGAGVTSDDLGLIDWTDGPYFVKTETDPAGGTNYTITGTSELLSVPFALFSKSTESLTGTINESQISDLQTYLTVETDPVFTAWDKSTDITITESQVTDLQSYLTAETDPVFAAWDKSTDITITESQVTDLQSYLTAETDPVFAAWDKSTDITITESQVTDLQSYLTAETDPVFTAWDKSTDITITESQVTDLQSYLIAESDPLYTASEASNITAGDITKLGNLSGTNTGDQDLSALATRANVLELNNTTAFTPDADYEPATKRYVDDATATGHYIGEIFGGGIVFWVSPDGAHGLIASLVDLDGGSGVSWGPLATTVGTISMTDGEANTATIVASGPGAGTAAVLCDQYSSGGFSDWYLPSNRELSLLVQNDVLIDYILDNDGNGSTQGFSQEYLPPTNGAYWCSTEFGGDNAWVYRFYSGNMNVSTKDAMRNVRAIRAF